MAKKDVPIEDLKNYLGKEISASDWFEIDQDRVNQFAMCTEDPQWIHTDEEKAKSGPFGGTIVHGLLMVSLVPSFLTDNFAFNLTGVSMFINYGFNKVRFIAPVMVGSRIRIRFVATEFQDKGNGNYLLNVSCTFDVEGSEKPACIAEYLAMFIK